MSTLLDVDREYREGFAEIIKHAAIRDAGLLDVVDALDVLLQITKQLVELRGHRITHRVRDIDSRCAGLDGRGDDLRQVAKLGP